MNKLVGRRFFLRMAATAPVAVQSASLEKIVAEKTLSEVGAYIGLAPASNAYGIGLLGNPKIYAALKAGLLPDWASVEIEEDHNNRYGYRIDPDIAALRSASVGTKLRMSRRRSMERMWAEADGHHARQLQRKLFFGQE